MAAIPDDGQLIITVKTLEHAIRLKQFPELQNLEIIHSGAVDNPVKTYETYNWNTAPDLLEVVHKDSPDVIMFAKKEEMAGHGGYVIGGVFKTFIECNVDYRLACDKTTPVALVKEKPVLVAGEDVSQYKKTPAQVKEQLRRLADGSLRRAIATTMIKEGGNFYHLTYIVRADGAPSQVLNIQFPGRAARVIDSKPVSFLLDPFDKSNKWVERRAEKRKEHYKKSGWFEWMKK